MLYNGLLMCLKLQSWIIVFLIEANLTITDQIHIKKNIFQIVLIYFITYNLMI